MQVGFGNGDRDMRRALIAFIVTVIGLFAIDWASSAILCGLEQKLSTIRDYQFCPYSGGIIRSGLETIARFKLEEWTAFGRSQPPSLQQFSAALPPVSPDRRDSPRMRRSVPPTPPSPPSAHVSTSSRARIISWI